MDDKFKFEAFVLAGGKSSRMGIDKGLMDFHGRKMIEHILHVLNISSRISIISNNEEYNQFGYPVCPDIYKNCGPLGGIHTGLLNAKSDWCLAVSCDLPFITSEFLKFLLQYIEDTSANAIVPVHNGHVEPLCAFYHKSCLQELERLILKKEFKMQTVVQKLKTTFVEVAEEEFNPSLLFRNMNSPADISSKYE